MASAMRSGGMCARWPDHAIHCASAASSSLAGRPTPVLRCRALHLKVLASESPPSRDEFFPQRLLEKVKLRLGFKQRIATSPGVDEELEKELARGLEPPAESLVMVKGREAEETVTTRDDLFPEVLWEQRKKDIEAEENQRPLLTSPGFSFSAAGHLFPYHLGVCDCLIDNGYLMEIAITQVFRQPRGILVDHFDSREDLINALHTSCFIPGYFAPKPITIFRNRVCIDGGFTLFMPPTAAEQTVRICAFFASAYKIKGVQISPDVNPSETRPTNQQLLSLAFLPAEDEVLDEMFRTGYEDALCWIKQRPERP